MTAHKCTVAVALAILGVLAANTLSVNGYTEWMDGKGSHNLIVGSRMPGDRLVLKDNIVKNSAWLKVQVIQKIFHVSQDERITMVKALDQKTNGNGAYASILNGGPGHNNVTMKFKSQRGHSINFMVEIYARF